MASTSSEGCAPGSAALQAARGGRCTSGSAACLRVQSLAVRGGWASTAPVVKHFPPAQQERAPEPHQGGGGGAGGRASTHQARDGRPVCKGCADGLRGRAQAAAAVGAPGSVFGRGRDLAGCRAQRPGLHGSGLQLPHTTGCTSLCMWCLRQCRLSSAALLCQTRATTCRMRGGSRQQHQALVPELSERRWTST